MARKASWLSSSIEVKQTDDDRGWFSGYLSVFGNIDSQKDVVVRGAFLRTIEKAEQKRLQSGKKYLYPLLWQHDQKAPIGGITHLREDDRGLYIEAELDLETEYGAQAYSGLKKGYVNGLSIGYITKKDEIKGNVRYLLEVDLLEGSVVTFPANEYAQVAVVKQDGQSDTGAQDQSFPDIQSVLGGVQLVECMRHIGQILYAAAKSMLLVVSAPGASEGKKTALENIIGQLSDMLKSELEGVDSGTSVMSVQQLGMALFDAFEDLAEEDGFLCDDEDDDDEDDEEEEPVVALPDLIDGMASGVMSSGAGREAKYGRVISEQNHKRLHQHVSQAEEAIKGMRAVLDDMAGTSSRKPQKAAESGNACGSLDWPLADRDRAWDASAAHGRIVAWAKKDGGDGIDASKMKSVHFYYEGTGDNITDYKLPFCDVVDGKVVAVPRGIFGCAGALQGARGGVSLSGDVEGAVRSRIEKYYARMRKEFNDDSLVPPWQDKGKGTRANSEKTGDHDWIERMEGLLQEMKGVLGGRI